MSLRSRDIEIARLAGFYIRAATLYTPDGSVVGGAYSVHSKGIELDDDTKVWNHYTPRFSTDLNDAMWLIQQLPIRSEFHLVMRTDRTWIARITHNMAIDVKPRVYEFTAPTAAMAICQAWTECQLYEQMGHKKPNGG